MKNRISVVLDPKDVAEYQAAQATQKRILHKWLQGADVTDITAGNYMGTDGGWTYCQDGYKFAVACPKAGPDEKEGSTPTLLSISHVLRDRDWREYGISKLSKGRYRKLLSNPTN